jgi:DNA invertase Pin-like site-specific DNA recombinase
MSAPKTKRNNKIRKLRKQKLSYEAIGKIFGINKKTVWEIINENKKY